MGNPVVDRGIANRFGEWLDRNVYGDGDHPVVLGDCMADLIQMLDDSVDEHGEDASNGEILDGAIRRAKEHFSSLLDRDEDDEWDQLFNRQDAESVAKSKPVVIGPVDSNIFAVIGAASGAMKRAGVDQSVIKEMSERAGNATSYHAAMAAVMEYVDFNL